MKIAITTWNGRVAPVFDSARCVRIYSIEPHAIPSQQELLISPLAQDAERAELLRRQGVEILICGAISNEAVARLRAHGIDVVAFIAGPEDAVLRGWRSGLLGDGSFHMPGCGCRKRHHGWR